MATIVWNPPGLPDWCTSKGSKLNIDYYVSDTRSPIATWRPRQVGAMDQTLIMRSDNARSHIAKKVDGFFANN
jgi:hypothetical protein